MNKAKLVGCLALFTAMSLGAVAPASASDKTTNTILGAGIGAAAGAILSKGDTLTTLGGAAAGGVLGNILTEDSRKRHHAGPPHRHPPRHAGRGYQPRHVYYHPPGKGKGRHHPPHRKPHHHHR